MTFFLIIAGAGNVEFQYKMYFLQISIPEAVQVQSDGLIKKWHVEYSIQVYLNLDVTRCQRRYREFHKFFTELKRRKFNFLKPIPPKKWGRLSQTVIESRRLALEAWLQDLVEN
jgi:hypothetical protein